MCTGLCGDEAKQLAGLLEIQKTITGQMKERIEYLERELVRHMEYIRILAADSNRLVIADCDIGDDLGPKVIKSNVTLPNFKNGARINHHN